MNKRTASFDKPRSSRKSRLSSPSGGSSSPRSDRGSSSSRVGLTISRSYGPGSGTEGDDEGQDELSASDLFAFDDGFVGSDAGATAGAGEAQSSRIGLPAFLTMSLDSSTPDRRQPLLSPILSPRPDARMDETALESAHPSSPKTSAELPLIDPFINKDSSFFYNPDLYASDVPLFKLNQDVLQIIYSACSARSISVLNQTCRHVRDSIARWQGFNAISLITLHGDQATEDSYSFNFAKKSPFFKSVGGSLPPHYSSKGHVNLGSKVYMPELSQHPSCYVFDLDTFEWTRHWLKLTTEPVDAPAKEPIDGPSTLMGNLFSSSSLSLALPPAPLPFEATSLAQSQSTRASHGVLKTSQQVTGPVTGYLRSDRSATLYVFGGTRQQPSTSSDSSSVSQPIGTQPTNPSSHGSGSHEGNTSSEFRSEGGTETSDSLYTIDTETWELRDLTKVTQGESKEDVEPKGGNDNSFGSKQPSPWPSPRREHSIDVVRGRWLVSLGGLASKDSIGENDVWVCDLDTNVWSRPEVLGRLPAPTFCHASAMINDDIYIFGGSQMDTPTDLTFDSLSRLSCSGPPSEWSWHNYRPSEDYAYSRSRRATRRQKAREAFTSSSEETSSGSTANEASGSRGQVSSLESARSNHHHQHQHRASVHPPSTATHLHPNSSPEESDVMSGVVSGTGEGSSGTSAELSGDSAESVGITTTGITPLERRDATMMVMGSDRLVLIGGTTIEDGHDRETGAVFDDVCGYNLGMIDIFDTTRKHWSKIRPSPSADQAPVFFLEGIYCSIPPTVDSFPSGWKVLAQGRAVDFDDILVNIVDEDQAERQAGKKDGEEGMPMGGSGSSSSEDERKTDSSGGSGPSMDMDVESEGRGTVPSMSSISSTPSSDMRGPGARQGGWPTQPQHIALPLNYALPRLHPDVPLSDFNHVTRQLPPPHPSALQPANLPPFFHPHAPAAPLSLGYYSTEQPYLLPTLQPQIFPQPTPSPPLIHAVSTPPTPFPSLTLAPPPLLGFSSSQPLSAYAPPFIPAHLSQEAGRPVSSSSSLSTNTPSSTASPLSLRDDGSDREGENQLRAEEEKSKVKKGKEKEREKKALKWDTAMDHDESYGTIGLYKRDNCLASVSSYARIRPVQYKHGKTDHPSYSDDDDLPKVLHAVPYKIATQLVVFA